MNAFRWILFFTLAMGMALLLVLSCGDDDDDDDLDCSEYVDNPTTDCEAVCTEAICTVLKECEDYIDVGSLDDCIDDCFEGCLAGCIPEGALDCLDLYTDCETLIQCLKPLFSF